jgi:hypothetical protein
VVFTILLFREWEEGCKPKKSEEEYFTCRLFCPNVGGGWFMESSRLMYSYTKKNLLLHHTQ